MKVTSSLLFELLKREYRVTEFGESANNLCVSAPRLLTPEKPRPDILYICEWNDMLPTLLQDGCSYLIIADRVPNNLIKFKASIAVISTKLTAMNLLYRVFELFEEIQDWDMALKDATHSPHSLADIFEIGQRMFHYPLALVDRHFNIVEHTQDLDLGFPDERRENGVKIPMEMVNELLLEPGFGGLETLDDVFSYPLETQEGRRICFNIHHGGQYVGRILANVSHGGTPGLRYLFEHLSGYISSAYLCYTNDILVKRQNDKLHTLFKQMLTENSDVSEKTIKHILEPYGWELDHEYTVNLIDLTGHSSKDTVLPYLCAHLERDWRHSCAISNENEIIWIVNNTLSQLSQGGKSFSMSFVYLIRDFCCKAGISSVFNMEPSLFRYYRQAQIALKFGPQKHPHYWYYRFSDYLLDYAFSVLSNYMLAEEFCHPCIRRLIEEDRSEGSELVKTLYCFLACNFNTSQAAERIFVHRSTFIRQMKKIKELTGIDWNEAVDLDTVLWVLASFHFLNISY